MTLIVCLDNKHGMLFNSRRQSRDACVCERILQITVEKRLCVNGYSEKLFPPGRCTVVENIFEDAGEDDAVFAECEVPVGVLESVSRLVIYRWNRDYPSDIRFPFDAVPRAFYREGIFEFSGNSHQRITEEVYVR